MAHGAGAGFLRGEHALGEAEVARDGESEDRREGHDAQAADDDTCGDDCLPEGGPVGRGVDGGQAGDADGGHGGEENVDEGGGCVGRGGDWQHQERRDDADDERECAQSEARG
ncbi:Uncharacterised protein [Mycobacteroides abscessus subsp. abscessus]|nr:Uncharacterised protein [Mycobacteroides abscessus subsp. abscessus]